MRPYNGGLGAALVAAIARATLLEDEDLTTFPTTSAQVLVGVLVALVLARGELVKHP